MAALCLGQERGSLRPRGGRHSKRHSRLLPAANRKRRASATSNRSIGTLLVAWFWKADSDRNMSPRAFPLRFVNRMEEAAGDCTNIHLAYQGLVYAFWHIFRANVE